MTEPDAWEAPRKNLGHEVVGFLLMGREVK